MPDKRPYTLLSAAVSLDGYLDDASDTRLLLSNDADFDAVDALRAGCDAILVGANTVRRDDPRLLVRSPSRRADRLARDEPETPLRVVLTAAGELPPSARLWQTQPTIVYSATGGLDRLRHSLRGHPVDSPVRVVDAGATLELAWVLADLRTRGVSRLLVEGGATVLTQFLTGGLADELRLAVAPRFVGDSRAPRFVADGQFPAGGLHLVDVDRLDGMAVLRYALSERGDRLAADRRWLRRAIELSRRCPFTERAYAVGAVLVGADGRELSFGYSRETDAHVHAEESALAKLDAAAPLAGATLYTSLEPCTARASRPRSCTELALAAGVGRVVLALREPPLFVDCDGVERLRAAGVEVVEVTELADEVRRVNEHLLGGHLT